MQLVSSPFTAVVVAPPESVSGGENETLAVREHVTWPGAGPLNFGGVPFIDSTSVFEELLPELPTAVQLVGPTQDTPPRPEAGGFPRFGLVTTDQVEPSHDSISVVPPIPSLLPPTAVQPLGLMHDTPPSELTEPGPFGLGTTDHEVPSHDSIKVCTKWVEIRLLPPTATHAVELVHDTAWSESPERPGIDVGSGLGTIDHADPFHDSTSVSAPLSESKKPTAVQSVGPVHDTPNSSSYVDVATSGLGTTDQEVPSHDSISVCWPLVPTWAAPTAMQCVWSEQDTPDRKFPVGEVEGLGTIDQEVPSHDSIRVSWSAPTSKAPTAMQCVWSGHDTPFRLFPVGEGEGLGTMDQLDPFHDSIKG